MNAHQIKQIKISDYLSSKNIQPKFSINKGTTYKYLSPFRNEKTPSFFVNNEKNVWYDHGEGRGGNIIDLAMILERMGFKQVLDFFNKYEKKDSSFSSNQQINKSDQTESNIEITGANAINKPLLRIYLLSRKIPIKLAAIYLKQIHYYASTTPWIYYALGFKNDLGGYELRSKHFKGSNSPKYFTSIKGTSNRKLNIFEGFFDFLSFLVLTDCDVPNYDTIVLNSLANIDKITDQLKKYTAVNLFFDNDAAGKKGTQIIKDLHRKVTSFSDEIYPEYKDLNEYLIAVKANDLNNKLTRFLQK